MEKPNLQMLKKGGPRVGGFKSSKEESKTHNFVFFNIQLNFDLDFKEHKVFW